MLSRKSPFFGLILTALLIRFISAATHSSWHHPDEWYQTVEFANLLLNGVATFSQEMALHLRNLTWPLILTLPLKTASLIAPDSIALRVFSFQFFSGLLDLAMIWGWIRIMESSFPKKTLPTVWKVAGLALLVLPYFMVADSIRPGAEHASMVATWIALGLLATRRPGWAGFAIIAIAALKYPSGLMSLGIGLGFLIQSVKKREGKGILRFSVGILAGLFIFGLSDWIFYGRPWESLWMYLQYNVLTDAGSSRFGTQSALVYFEFFRSRWLGFLFPLGLGILFFGARGLFQGCKKTEPWALATLFYIVGHLLVGHKEPRFLWPVEPLLIFAAWAGSVDLIKKIRVGTGPRRWFKRGLTLIMFINGVMILRALWGETGRPNQTYFELPEHLREFPDACAVLTVRNPPSVLFPSPFPREMPLGVLELDNRRVIWIGKARPMCISKTPLLVHADKTAAFWTENRCELISRGLPKAPWYRCPGALVTAFQSTFENPLLHGLKPIPKLPPFGVDSKELIRLATQGQTIPDCNQLCFRSDLR